MAKVKSSAATPRRGSYKPYELHGGVKTREYKAWHHMLSRCRDPNNKDWHSYGGRGIRVCERWQLSFVAFRDDLGPCPEGLTLERKDPNGDYEPGNCCWETLARQARNQRRAHIITFKGRTQNLCDWAAETGLPQIVISRRIKRGWSVGRALTEPSQDNRVLLTHNGITQMVAAWARDTGLDQRTISGRLRRGWSIERTLTTPRLIQRKAM